ncbi:MAG: radical SAM protein [archaeon]
MTNKSKKVLLVANMDPVTKQHPEHERFWRAYLASRAADNSVGLKQDELPFYANLGNQNIGLLHLGGILKKRNHIVDYFAPWATLSEEEFVSGVLEKSKDSDFLGFYSHTCGVPLAEKLTVQAKEANPELTVVLGGPHPSGFTEKEDSPIDIYARGKGHKVLPWIVEANVKKSVVSERDIPEDYFQGTEEPSLFPQPDNSLMNVDFLPAGRIYTTLGCGKTKPCTFCSSINQLENKHFVGDLEKIISYVEELVDDFGTKFIYIGDENFFRNPEHSSKLVRELKDRFQGRLTYFVQGNAESILQRPELLKELGDSGMCKEVQVGAESADQKVLNLARKGLRAKVIKEAGEMVKEQGMRYFGNWLSWLPGESESTQRYTTDAICRLMSEGIMDYAESYIVIPSPGSALFNSRDEYGLKIVDWNYSGWKGETFPVFEYEGGIPREKMHELDIERVTIMADIYESKLPLDFKDKLGVDPSRIISGF